MNDVVRKPRLRPLSAVRVALVVFIGPVMLVAATVAAAAEAARSLRADGAVGGIRTALLGVRRVRDVARSGTPRAFHARRLLFGPTTHHKPPLRFTLWQRTSPGPSLT